MKRLVPMLALPLVACAPLPPASAGPTASIGQQTYVDGLRVRPLQVLEDSRCPVNVQCVRAGRIIVRAEVSGGRWRQVRDLELGKPEPIADGQLTLVAAEPGTMAGIWTNPRAYRFTFRFDGGL
jgi:hypothetical protein